MVDLELGLIALAKGALAALHGEHLGVVVERDAVLVFEIGAPCLRWE
jgi:hypothetical protein